MFHCDYFRDFLEFSSLSQVKNIDLECYFFRISLTPNPEPVPEPIPEPSVIVGRKTDTVFHKNDLSSSTHLS